MKKIGFSICFTLVLGTAFAQHSLKDSICATGNVMSNPFGEFACQYNRIITQDTVDYHKVIITFVFINGNSTMAIQYRQEAMTGSVAWIDTTHGRTQKENFVEMITATVPPNHVISWKHSFIPETKPNPKAKIHTMKVDKAALLILDDNMEVRKELFSPVDLIISRSLKQVFVK